MKRKVIKQGNGTLTITLPKQWTKEVGLTDKDEVEFTINQNKLLVSPPDISKEKKISINVDNFQRLSFAKFLIACYEMGFDTMELRFTKKNVKSWSHGEEKVNNVINFFITRLVGFEILSQTNTSIVIGNISEKHLKFERIISRLYFLMEEYIDNLIEALKDNRHELLNDGEQRHDNITKLIALALRILYESDKFTKIEVMSLSTILNLLDKITDFIRHNYVHIHKHHKKISKETIELMKHAREFFEMYRHFYNKFSYEAINDLDDKRGEIRKLFLRSIKTHPQESSINSNFNAMVETLNGGVKPRICMELEKDNSV